MGWLVTALGRARISHTLGGREVDDVAVLLEHVDLLNGLDGLGVELLQGGLELLVVRAGAGGRPLDLATGRPLATANLLDHHIPNSRTEDSVIRGSGGSYRKKGGVERGGRCGVTYPTQQSATQQRHRQLRGEGSIYRTDPGGGTELLEALLNFRIHLGRVCLWRVCAGGGEGVSFGQTAAKGCQG